MTLDDLEKAFWGDQREQPIRVRLARVVRALRDEIEQSVPTDDDYSVCKWLDGILASAGEGEAAGGPTSNAGKAIGEGGALSAPSTPTPAAAPAPVCEWKALSHSSFMRQCSKYPTTSAAGPYCSNCGKVIVEAK